MCNTKHRMLLVVAAVLALLDAAQLAYAQAVPVIPVPAGYGRYCSITYPDGRWAFATLAAAGSDPCATLLKASPANSGGKIQRAGLWSVKGDNNVLVRCGSQTGVLRGTGGKPTGEAYNNSGGKKDCIFTVAPTKLAIFTYPYGKTTASQAHPSDDVKVGRGFDYDVYPWANHPTLKATDYGQPA